MVIFTLHSCLATVVQLDWGLGKELGTTVVTKGDTVVWTWIDAAPHSVQSIGEPSFTSSDTKTGIGNQHSIQFQRTGQFVYNCLLHGDSMKGIILVHDIPTARPTRSLVLPSSPSMIPSEDAPTHPPTEYPTNEPSGIPTGEPSLPPSDLSTRLPSLSPTTLQPSLIPTFPPKRHVLRWRIGATFDLIRILVGDTVVWNWTDSVPHNVRSLDGKFNSSEIMTGLGSTFEVTFYRVGLYPFDCSIHPLQMKGAVLVQATPEDGSDSSSESSGWDTEFTALVVLLCGLFIFHGN